MNLKKLCLIIFLVLIILYVFVGIILFFKQKTLLYYPTEQNFETCKAFKDYEKLNYQDTRFYFKENSKNIVVIYHGNGGSACNRAYLASLFDQSGDSLIFVEYAGYSNDDKKPSKDLILRDVENIKKFIEKENFKKVTVYGESLGGAAASYQAYLGKVDKLILISPFSSLEALIQVKYFIYPTSILLRETYDNFKSLQNFAGQILIVHGENDSLIPYHFSKELFDQNPSKSKEYLLIPEIGHELINHPELFKEKVNEFIEKSS